MLNFCLRKYAFATYICGPDDNHVFNELF